MNKHGLGGELLDTCQRHQRDLFSGDLGIPNINTHVGSVVHTFETLAMLRRQNHHSPVITVTSSGTSSRMPVMENIFSSRVYKTSRQECSKIPEFNDDIENDYRKRQFDTMPSMSRLNGIKNYHTKDFNNEDRIVNNAFKDIFIGYNCDEDDVKTGPSNNSRAPRNRKAASPVPPTTQPVNANARSQPKNPISPPKPIKSLPNTIFDRIKCSNKTKSSIILSNIHMQPRAIHRYFKQLHIHSIGKDDCKCNNDEDLTHQNDFQPGKTIRQSFITNPVKGTIRENFRLKSPVVTQQQSSMPLDSLQPPSKKLNKNSLKKNKMGFFTMRSKSSIQLLLDDFEPKSEKCNRHHQDRKSSQNAAGSGYDKVAPHIEQSYNLGSDHYQSFPPSVDSIPCNFTQFPHKNDFRLKRGSSHTSSYSFHPCDSAEI
ncbi:uncharacterized protein LOC129913587 isoform X2 [Episyrphus balteatus]|nr:uncharacterized protein LOC129913587 isoform X2 [Episyrphus balteatus]